MNDTTTTLLTIATAAERRGVHHSTIRRWIRESVLPATRLSDGTLRINAADLDAARAPERVKPRGGDTGSTLRRIASLTGGELEDLGVDGGGAHRWRIVPRVGAPLLVEQALDHRPAAA